MSAPVRLTPPATVFAWCNARLSGGARALFALDDTLAEILRSTREPLVGQMRLTWWHDALAALGANVPAHPVLRSLAEEVIGVGVPPSDLAGLVEGWEALLEAPLTAPALAVHGDKRGAALFALLAGSMGVEPDQLIADAGRGWALADLAGHLGDAMLSRQAATMAQAALGNALGGRWRGGRAIGALAADAAQALAHRGDAGSPRRAMRALGFRLTGR